MTHKATAVDEADERSSRKWGSEEDLSVRWKIYYDGRDRLCPGLFGEMEFVSNFGKVGKYSSMQTGRGNTVQTTGIRSRLNEDRTEE